MVISFTTPLYSQVTDGNSKALITGTFREQRSCLSTSPLACVCPKLNRASLQNFIYRLTEILVFGSSFRSADGANPGIGQSGRNGQKHLRGRDDRFRVLTRCAD